MPKILSFRTQNTFCDTASNFVATHVLKSTAANQRTSIFLSGGSTPGPIYEKLSSYELPWQQVDIGLVDERWVDEHDPGSNAALVRKTLLNNLAKDAGFVPMKSEHDTAIAGQSAIEAAYSPLFKGQSLAVLGMGPDGHTASWFSGAQGIEQALARDSQNTVQAITAKPTKVTGHYLERMTLTLSALAQCQALLLLTKGAEKRSVLEQAFQGPTPDLPISYLIDAVGERLTILHLDS